MTEIRPYQKAGIQQIFQHWKEGLRSVLFQMPTGTGKTILFNEITRRGYAQDRKILIVAHRQELVRQTVDKLEARGVPAGIIMAGEVGRPDLAVQVASIQTLGRRGIVPPAHLIIIDECHHAKAETYRKLWDMYPDAKFLGVTATPVRLNGEGFQDLFDVLVPSMPVKAFIEAGYLAPVRHFVCKNPDLRGVKVKRGDYETDRLAEVMREADNLASLILAWQQHAEGKATIVFAVNVAHSLEIAHLYNSFGIPTAHLDAKTPSAERVEILRKFKAGELKVVSNVEIITEGFDFPECEVVQLARPTQSLALYLQMVGRAMRPAPGKAAALVLDNAGLWKTHGLVTTEREWKLEGRKRRRGEGNEAQPVMGMDEDGVMHELDEHDLNALQGLELVELRPEQMRLRHFDALLEDALFYEYKLVSAYFKYLEFVFEVHELKPTVEELQYMRAKIGDANARVAPELRLKDGFWGFQFAKAERFTLREWREEVAGGR